ncbi:hypothetical protein [Paracoccus sp. (in: a-proteobacteria)]|uniref:hypothetical protein n=1 Tax=Paracoccus sp. TaxID=267 RepID=UPI00289EA5F2|nr:hypothetical protein [Paracoccus sp. (in: a-proteobacteria)]
MPKSMRRVLLLPLILLAACAQTTELMTGSKPTTASQDATSQGAETSMAAGAGAAAIKAPVPRGNAKTAAEFNTTTTAQKAEAAKAPSTAEAKLGSTVASLGDPTLPGFWIKTPLVKTAAEGRIVNPANGKSAKVQLQPLAGPASGGSQVSLPALQLIGVSLTDLPTIEVYKN